MNSYYNELVKKISDFTSNDISLVELVSWSNETYSKFIHKESYKLLENRLVNDILISLREFEDQIDNLEDLSENEKKYLIGECNTFLNKLSGNEKYIEIYQISNDLSILRNELNEIFDTIYKLLENRKNLSKKLLKYIYLEIKINKCKTIDDIIISEILNSILLLNESVNAYNEEIFIGNLGNVKGEYRFKDELKYLQNLLKVFKGEKDYRFSLMMNGSKILYTNISIL